MEPFNHALKAYNEGAVFVAFDLETTGLDPKLDCIVEIGAVKFDNKGLIARFSALINPGIPMPEEAGKVNNISDEMLRGKPSLEQVLPDFLRFIRGTVLTAHNTAFDCAFIRCQTPLLANPIADTLVYARERFPGMGSYSLQNLALDLGIPAREAHRAEDDARLCMEILLRCLETGGSE